MLSLTKEKKRLNKISGQTKFGDGFNGRLVVYRYLTLKRYFKGKSALELGPAEGPMTKKLVNDFDRVLAVDGSLDYCNMIKKTIKNNNLDVICSMFEDYSTNEKFDTIIMAHILEHVSDPVYIMNRARNWLKPGGVMLIDVPNANSLHRQAGVQMKLLKKVDQLNSLDVSIGHRRVYTLKTLSMDIKRADLKIVKTGGLFLKLLTNEQLEQQCTTTMQDAFFELGKKYKQIAGEIYAVCTV